MGETFAGVGLLIALTTVNLLLFYFNQFAAVSTTILEFMLLIALLRYRQIYLGIGSSMDTLSQLTDKSV